MPRLSLYKPTKSNDYRFFDRTISEMFTAGATDLYVHKYLGPADQGPSTDYTQPQYDIQSPTNIQDLLFLENRDRSYEPNIYRIRGHYNVQNLDFNLSQFGLFLNNDVLFITMHYNDMIDLVGRKLIVGDVLELPHLLDYNPLNEAIPVSLRRYYQVTDGNFASEGFSATWFPHLWRIKCEPLVNSQEFSQILDAPVNTDNYLGQWDATKDYPAGYVITYGDKNYVSNIDVPAGNLPPDPTYWSLDPEQNLKDILSTYNKNISINDAVLAEAARILPKSGYDNSNLYVLPTYGPESDQYNQPAPPIFVVTAGLTGVVTGSLVMMRSAQFKTPSPAIRITKQTLTALQATIPDSISAFLQMSLQTVTIAPEKTSSGSGAVENTVVLSVQSLGTSVGPYTTQTGSYTTPPLPGIDADPSYQYISRATPRSFGYTVGWLTGTEAAPNGLPVGSGDTFPPFPALGDYFLRTDYLPQLLYRWDSNVWVRISENVRTDTGFTAEDRAQVSTFINNFDTTALTDGTTIPQKQALSTILRQPAPVIDKYLIYSVPNEDNIEFILLENGASLLYESAPRITPPLSSVDSAVLIEGNTGFILLDDGAVLLSDPTSTP